jgi:MFS family permease
MCIIKRDTSVVGWVFLNIVPGLGLGSLFPSIGYAVQASADPRNLSIAVAMFSFFRALGQAIGVAVGGVVFQNQMHKNLLKYDSLAPMASAYSKDAAGLVQVIKAMPDGMDKNNLKDAYTDSLRIVWIVCCAISAVALAFSLLTEEYDLDRALETDQGLDKKARLESEKDLELNTDRAISQAAPMAW